jgi:molybdenum cofactor cytidylyltransferase
MNFGDTPVGEAEGAILAHGTRAGDKVFKKGRVLTAEDIAALVDSGVASVVAARLEAGDVDEDTAATRMAAAVTGDGLDVRAPFTGRCNLFAEGPGVVVYDAQALSALNRIDESLTIATLPPFASVQARQMVATIKVIPFAAPEAAVAAVEETAAGSAPLLRIAPYQATDVGLIQSRLPGTKETVLDKTVGATAERLDALGSRLTDERRCDHTTAALANAIQAMHGPGIGMILIAGASAITDRRDVIPAAIEKAGGHIQHFGMPVDPGNLLLLGRMADRTPVIGLPGCARSPKRNGFDWVLERLLAGLDVGDADIEAMGPGGLLKEIPSRPLPRADIETAAIVPTAPNIAALVLAAGQSRRMGRTNKLLAEVDGVPMVARVSRAVAESKSEPVVVVLGHEAERVRDCLGDLDVIFVDNPDYTEGLSTSLAAGLAALPGDVDGVVVCLGDMPRVRPGEIDRLISGFDLDEGRAICVPTHRGKRGNPVLWARRFFSEMAELRGDVGARHLIGEYAELVVEIEMEDDGVLVDVDTPDALTRLAEAGAKGS